MISFTFYNNILIKGSTRSCWTSWRSRSKRKTGVQIYFFPHRDELLALATYFHVSKNRFRRRLYRLLQGEAGAVGSRGERGGPGEKVSS